MNDILFGRNDTSAVELDPHFGTRAPVGIQCCLDACVATGDRPGWQPPRGVRSTIFAGNR